MDSRDVVDRVWYGQDAVASTLRTVLVPAERMFGAIVGARDILYDAGWLPAAETPIPAVSIFASGTASHAPPCAIDCSEMIPGSVISSAL